MSKHLKRGVAVALALAMTTQFGLENPYVYAEGDTSKEDAETQKDPTPTEEESQETQPESAILTVDYVTEDGEVLDSHEFSGINVGDKVLAIDIEKSFDGYTLVRVEDADNEYVIGQDLTLTKPEKNIRLIYKADTKQEEITEDSKEEEPQVSPNSVTDTEDENETVYFVVHYYDENGDLIPVTTDNKTEQYVKQGETTTPPHQPVLKGGKKFVGWFTQPNGQGEKVHSFVITSDSNFYAYYEAQTAYTITINYVFADSGNQAAKPYIAEVAKGDSFQETVPSPELDGYTPDQQSVEINLDSVTADQTYTVKYTGEKQTYTVKHMLQNVEGNGYTEDKSARETLEGYIGNYTDAKAKTYEGFTAQEVNNTKITSNTTEDNVTIEIRYNRESYNISFITGEKGSYIPTQRVYYGTNLNDIVSKQKPTRLGYTFTGWVYNGQPLTDDMTMPAEDVTLTATWKENTDASYTIVYWLENLDGTGYDYVTSKTGNGSVGSEITANNLNSQEWNNANIDSNGVERDTSKDETVTIEADGSTVKNVYYSRKTFHIYFYTKNQGRWTEDESLRIDAKYGEDITSQWNDDEHTKYSWVVEGYQDAYFGKKWYTLFANMPAEDIKTYADEQYTGIHIVYKIQNLDGSGYTEKARFPAKSGVSLTPEDRQPIDGFEYSREGEERHGSGWDRHFDLVLYYDRNSYDISFENCDGIENDSLKYEEKLSNAKPNDSSVKPPAGVDDDYIFAGWYTSPACEDGTQVDWSSTMPSHNMQVYAKWVAPTYTVSFDTNGAGEIDPINVQKYGSIEGNMPENPTKEGDTFLGWYTDENFLYEFVPETNIVEDLTLYAKWESSTKGSYTIKYVDESGNKIHEPTYGEANLNTYVTIDPISIDGYTAKEGSSSQLLDQDNKEFKVVYKKDATWKFTVRYQDQETRADIIPAVTQEIPTTTQQIIVQSPSMDWVSALKDYMIVSDPQITVNQDSVTGEDYTVTFWYVKKQQTYTVNHQLQMPDGTYQTVESEKVNGNIGYYVTAEPNTYEGYNCVSTQYQRSGVVTSHADNEDGLVIDIHYDRQNPISISDYEGYYDGDSHGLTVNGKAIQTKLVKEQIEYSLDSSNWSSDPIAQKDVNDNGKAYTVYTRINTIIGDQKYYGSVETHSIWIKPRPVTIKAPDAEKTYDGTVLNTFGQPAEIIKDDTTSYGFVGDEGFINYYYTSDSQITAPGEQPNKIAVNSVKVDSNLKAGTLLKNYAITFEDGTLKITDREDADKYQLIITPNSSITTYDGKEQSVSGIQSSVFTTKEGTPLSGYTITGATFAASGTDAGTYSVKQTGELKILDADKNDVTNQFAVTVNQASLIINQRPVTIAADSQTWDYDGQPHSLPTSHVTENTLADGHSYTATVKADTADGTIQEQGESAINTISDVVIKDKQGNDVTKNYIIKTTIGTLRINAIDAAIVAHVTIANKTSTYNGEMQKFTDLEGKDYELSFSFAKPEDEIDTSGWHLINDGITTQRLTAGTSKAVFADPTNVKVVDKEGHEVTTAQLSVTQGSLTVSPAKITIKANSAQREYNGEVLTAQGYTPSGLQSKDTIGSIEIIGSQLKPGSSDNVITEGSVRILNPDYQNYDVTNSYQITLEKGTLTVTNDEKADRKITITAANSQKTYDGTPLTQKVFRIEGDLEAGDSIDRNSIKTIGSQTVVGTSENTIDSDSVHILNGDVDVTDAYTIEYKSGTLEVTKRAITLTGGSASKVYDGTPLTAPKVTLTGTLAQGDDFDLTPQSLEQVTDVTGPQGKENPVSKTFKIQTADGEDRTDCYEITYVSGRLVIIKAPASENVVSIDSDTIVYDGKSHQLDKATSKVAKGTTIYYRKQGSNEWTETMPSYTDAGTYPIEVKAENANYEDSFARGTLVIRRRPVTITGNSDTFTYNGKEQTIEGYTWTQQDGDTGLVNGQQITDVTAKASATNAGKNIAGTITQEKDVKILADGKDVSKNYLITTIPGSITITPKKVTITSADAEKKFNGQALIKHEISEEPELADGDQVKYSFTGMQTNIGTGKNTFTANFYKDGTMINSNYSVEYQYGELIVYGEINYDANGGTGEAPKPDRYDAGDTYEVKDNMFERKGYTFTGWNTSPDGSGVSYGKGAIINSLTNNQTLYAQWKADEDTAYTVEVYLEGEDGNYPEDPTYSYERTGTTGSVVKVTDKDLTAPDGYAYDPQANNITEGTVAGDGSLVLKIYFGKDEIGPDPDDGGDNIPDRYQILFTYVAKENGSVSGNVYEVHTFTTPDGEYTKPSAITPEAKVAASANPGYQISAWKDEDDTDLGNGEQPDFEGQRYATNQIFTASFEEKDEIQISYKAEDGGSVDNDQDVIRPATGKPEGSTASANPGYHFVGWYLNDEKVEDEENFVPEKNAQGIYEEATYVAKFAPNEDTKYVVERYFSDEDGNYSSTPDETLTYQGTTNTKVSISEKDQIPPEGYAFDPQADNVMEGSVAGDGSLVLKIYFGKDTIGPDPDDGGDGIPDRYQILFTYVAEDNGTVSGTTHELHTFVNDSGEYYEPTPIAPEANVIADSNDGYAIERWRDQNSNDLGNDVAPVFEEHKYSENHTFTVSFTELENVIISYEAQEGGSVNNPQDAINPETGDPQGSTATVNDGYEFEGWYLNDEKISDELTFVPTKNENGRYESATYVAHFSKVAVPVVEEEKPQMPDKPENSKGTDTAEQTKMGLYLSSMSSAGLLGLIMLLKRKKEEK